ncbi:M23 family metallopeptidase [Arcanobacterium ihumii]|uniref:M23 family metallopeptidase n=1 Tax=Arcanobacterium ihumii TaxID=2138162 RepID=UPI000F545F0E|nr:M23 family metallopeptidase [Arcanobacterium ihumii]
MTTSVNEKRSLPSRRELRIAAQREAQEATLRTRSGRARSASVMDDDARARRLQEMLERSQAQGTQTQRSHRLAIKQTEAVAVKDAVVKVASPAGDNEKPPVLAIEESEVLVEEALAECEAQERIECEGEQLTEALPVLKHATPQLFRSRITFNKKFGRSNVSAIMDRVRAGKTSPILVGTGVLSAVALVSTGVLQIQDAVGAQSTTGQNSVLNSVHVSSTWHTPETILAKDGAADGARLRAAEEAAQSAQTQCIPQTGANSLVGSFVSEGNALFMPMKAGTYRVSSTFGYRSDPFGLGAKLHEGQDFAASDGTPFYAVADGKVLHAGAGLDGAASNMIVVQHEINGKTFTSWYLHMWSDGILVKEGDTVKAGQKIGLVGSQGRSTGPHLHLEIHPGAGTGTNAVEPMEFLKAMGARELGQSCN